MSQSETISILFLGDVIGAPGRRVVACFLDTLAEKPDLVVANVENCAHGFGVTQKNLAELSSAGVKVFTGGNHTFDRKEIFDFIETEPYLLRPANYPDGTPGRGHCLINVRGASVGIVNLQGRVFMEPLQSPFLVADALVSELKDKACAILVDIHAEATAEKVALGWYLDGRVSAVVGSHTHVQTADERILPGGTAYITDMGCCGPADGVIGMERTAVLKRFVNQLPARFDVAPGVAAASGVFIEIDPATGCAVSINRVGYRELPGD